MRILSTRVPRHRMGGRRPRPWVARITGPDSEYGLRRQFVKPMTDWRHAHRAISGNLTGLTVSFALRENAMYEVACWFAEGPLGKWEWSRHFTWLDSGGFERVSHEEIMDWVQGDSGSVSTLELIESDPDHPPRVFSLLRGGVPRELGWASNGARRVYRLAPGLFEIDERDARRLVMSGGSKLSQVTEEEALAWLAT